MFGYDNIKRAFLGRAFFVMLICSTSCDSTSKELMSEVNAFCADFAVGLRKDASASKLGDIEYRGRPRDLEQFKFCAGTREMATKDRDEAIARFSVLAQDVRSALIQVERNEVPPKALQQLHLNMAELVEALNAKPIRLD